MQDLAQAKNHLFSVRALREAEAGLGNQSPQAAQVADGRQRQLPAACQSCTPTGTMQSAQAVLHCMHHNAVRTTRSRILTALPTKYKTVIAKHNKNAPQCLCYVDPLQYPLSCVIILLAQYSTNR